MAEIHNKLVRDKIPEIIRENGGNPITRELADDEYKKELLKKLVEEASELLEDPSLEERADVAEVLKSIDELLGFSEEEIESTRAEKAENRGAFSARIFLEKVIE